MSGAQKPSKLTPGQIVRAMVSDPEGRNPKVRPLVLLTGDDDAPADAPLIAVAISSTLPKRLPDHYVLLPWHRAGNRQTGLKMKCAAVCDWFVQVQRAAFVEVMGRVPDAKYAEIRQKVQAIQQRQPPKP